MTKLPFVIAAYLFLCMVHSQKATVVIVNIYAMRIYRC